MTFTKGNMGFFFAFIIIGAILGSSLGTLLAGFFPSLSFLKGNLTGPLGFNLEIISFSIKLNPAAIVGLLAGIVVFRRV